MSEIAAWVVAGGLAALAALQWVSNCLQKRRDAQNKQHLAKSAELQAITKSRQETQRAVREVNEAISDNLSNTPDDFVRWFDKQKLLPGVRAKGPKGSKRGPL